MYEKTDVPNMVIDKTTGLVLNQDLGGYSAIKHAREEKKRQYRLESRVIELEQMVTSLQHTVAVMETTIEHLSNELSDLRWENIQK